MEDLVRRFRRGAEERLGRRYPESLKQLATGYAQTATARGRSLGEVASDLGICGLTLQRWLGQEPAAVPTLLHEVAVLDRGPSNGPILVTPSGLRVEGLSLDELVSLLESLG